MKLAHSSPLGALEIPTVSAPVEPGETFDVPDEIAEGLLTQSDLYRRVNPIDQLRADAEALGIDTAGMKKAQLQEAIAEAATATEANSEEEQK